MYCVLDKRRINKVMIVIPVDIECLIQIAAITILFETLRIAIAFVLAKPSSEVVQLEMDKYVAQLELAKIKSVQLEFVKHSLLSRKVISIEKKIENIQMLYSPRLLRVKKIFRILRVLAYSGIGVYLGNKSIVLISPQLMWPISWFTSRVTISPYAFFIIFIFGGTFRHVLRTLLPLIFTRTTFP